MNTRNLLYCVAGLALGFAVGFYLANQINLPARPADDAPSAASADGGGTAGPLDAEKSGGPLPPGHPDISGTASDGSPADPNGAAATDADAQQAMEAADRRPGDFAPQLEAARTFFNLRAYDKAALYAERALKLRPEDADALVLAGNTKYDAGDFPAAATYYERALAVRPDDADVRGDLGNTYSQRQPPDYARAVEEYRKALRVNPRHEISLQNMASAAVKMGDKATAQEAVEKLAAANPANRFVESLRAAVAQMK
ncbi:MAG: tetratricopeptide repeat protein [Acidobacteria bacterium]|nr:tetratricopeptide repeat protein [Acidobacteriota bacterium]